MLPLHLLDEDAVEALLTGRPVTPGLAPLAGAVGQLRAAARQPVRPSEELARRMATGDFSGIPPAPLSPEPAGRRRIRAWLTGVSPRARVVTGAVVVFTGLTAATAAGALPGGAQAHVEKFIETVTPISFQHDEPGTDVVEDVSDTGTTTEPDTGRPEDPGEPVRPPGKPETPPGKPPEKPDNPNKPEEPPGKPPEKPDNPNKPESPPGKPEKPEKPGNEGNGNGNSGNGNSGNGQGNSGNNGNGNGNGNSGNGNNGNGNGP
ncbi:hypothetical protein [Jiangella alba]|uniref:Uncharacterized protein n=2 Tax=Jiangella alba TaxID=561176 RepID=A0A1H5P8S3_9ACTN|nr:hypothetical protein [Jiangella alba]SEF10323.1 hypothetical protein SAMN04488561_3924 [Jiangella alba]